MRGGSTSPGSAVTVLRVSSWRKRGMPAPRSMMSLLCSASSGAIRQGGDQPGRLLLAERLQLDVDDLLPTGHRAGSGW